VPLPERRAVLVTKDAIGEEEKRKKREEGRETGENM
jgi:hypothetical protein